MWIHRSAALAVGLSLAVSAQPLTAQTDYRNLDRERPVTTEDAYPVERHAFELLIPFRTEQEQGGEPLYLVPLEIEYGILDNTQVGVGLPIGAVDRTGSETESGLAGLQVFGLYNFNTETPGLPALSLGSSLALPVGGLAGDAVRASVSALATRSWGLTRAHLNATWSFGSEDQPGVEFAPRWSYSLAVDRTLFRQSLLLVGEILTRRPVGDSEVEVNLALGTRYQLNPTLVLDAGIARRLASTAGPDYDLTVGLSHAFGLPWLTPGRPRAAPVPDRALGRDRRDEWFYLPGSFNWRFLDTYPSAARLFNAFDYGHAVLYDQLYQGRGKAEEALEKEYDFLTTDLLARPPRFAVVEEAVMPSYAKAAWRAKQMFDWAHLLHRQIYDVYSDDRLGPAAQDSLVERVTDYYLARREYAFAPVPKSMDLMEEQYFSKTFRRAYPRFNGLIWAYHWLQVGLYEPLIEGRTQAEREAGVNAAVARFWSMLEDPPSRMPAFMPMTSAIAPRFSERHPRAAAIFDNLHMMHDIISDVLTANAVSHERKRRVIYAQLDELRDSTRNTMTWDEWRAMADMMGGVAAMGGPATGLIAAPPTVHQPAHEHEGHP
jgi:hypothetical protein